MLRISIVTDADAGAGPSAATIRLEGKLLSPWRDEVRCACRAASSAGRTVRLDLYDVDFIDNDGVALVRALRDAEGVILSRCSNFVAELLQTEHV